MTQPKIRFHFKAKLIERNGKTYIKSPALEQKHAAEPYITASSNIAFSIEIRKRLKEGAKFLQKGEIVYLEQHREDITFLNIGYMCEVEFNFGI